MAKLSYYQIDTRNTNGNLECYTMVKATSRANAIRALLGFTSDEFSRECTISCIHGSSRWIRVSCPNYTTSTFDVVKCAT